LGHCQRMADIRFSRFARLSSMGFLSKSVRFPYPFPFFFGQIAQLLTQFLNAHFSLTLQVLSLIISVFEELVKPPYSYCLKSRLTRIGLTNTRDIRSIFVGRSSNKVR